MYTQQNPSSQRNTPRFLDFRRSPLPLDVALSFALPNKSTSASSSSPRELLLSEKVLVNSTIETSPHRLICRHNDCIIVDGIELARPIQLPRYFVCYKPRGVVCSTRRNDGIDREDSVLISEWLESAIANSGNAHEDNDATTCESQKPIKSVGRLDEESEGLLLLTNDGSFSRLLCDPEFGLQKTYRVVARCSGISNLEDETLHSSNLAERVSQMIERGNQTPGNDKDEQNSTQCSSNSKRRKKSSDITKPHFPFERCHVLDVGKLPTQHFADISVYALVDLVLREGKRHAVRRIIKNGGLRVCYLSRIAVEGLEIGADKPDSLVEAEERGFLPGGRHQMVIPLGELVLRSDHNHVGSDSTDDNGTLNPGHVRELNVCDVDRIFALRN